MTSLVVALFWTAVGVTAYNFLVYPRLLALLSRSRRSFPVRAGSGRGDPPEEPLVSVILPVERDEKNILDRLQNLLESDYPLDRLEIVVGCDAADDLTRDLTATVNDPRVDVVTSHSPGGRTGIINDCLAQARGDVVVLTDCDVKFQKRTIGRLAGHFRSPHVGGVCGRLTSPDASGALDGEQARAGELSRAREVKFGVVPESASRVAAYRKELLRPFADELENTGQFVALLVYRSGLELVYDRNAVGRTRSSTGPNAGGYRSAVNRYWNGTRCWIAALREAGFSAAAFVLASHLLWRKAAIFQLAALFANAALAGNPFYLRLLLLHELIYFVVLSRLCFRIERRWPLAKKPAGDSGA